MKKLLLILGFLVLSAPVSAQSDNPFHHNEKSYTEKPYTAEPYSEEPSAEEPLAEDPGGGGLGGNDVPIDDYLPVLLVTGLAMATYYARKKQTAARPQS